MAARMPVWFFGGFTGAQMKFHHMKVERELDLTQVLFWGCDREKALDG